MRMGRRGSHSLRNREMTVGVTCLARGSLRLLLLVSRWYTRLFFFVAESTSVLDHEILSMVSSYLIGIPSWFRHYT